MMIYLLKMMKTSGDFPLLGFFKKNWGSYITIMALHSEFMEMTEPHVVTWLAIGCYIPSGKHTKSY
jgi:hypothetical protein